MKTINLSNKTVLISRTDSIGDVILTLPICGWLKQKYPGIRLLFLGRKYTVDVLKCSPYIDEILCYDDWEDLSFDQQVSKLKDLDVFAFFHVFPKKQLAKLAKTAKIPYRIGTSHRLYHLLTCNVRPNFTRKNSDYHEAQLNFELFKQFGVSELPTREELTKFIGDFNSDLALNNQLEELLAKGEGKRRVILHPKSQGSAVEWPMEKYVELAEQLTEKNYIIYFSGTEKEGQLFRAFLPENKAIIDISGKSSLGEFITFIAKCDALVACSTGPLHIAAVLGINAIGLYTDLRPMHPGRWAPIGSKSRALTAEKTGD